MVGDCEELRLRCETLSGNIQTAELESKASRETILRLVSESKKQEGLKEELERLQSEVKERQASLITSEQERAGLQERLTIAKDTMISLEHEIQAKDGRWVEQCSVHEVSGQTCLPCRLSEVCRNMEACRLASDSSKSLVSNVQIKVTKLL